MATRRLPEDAFEYYFSLGPGRSYRAVAEHFGSSKSAVANLAAREDWQSRVNQRDAKAREETERRAVEEIAELNSRHVRAYRILAARALETLKAMPIETAFAAARALDIAVRGERLVAGQATDRTETSIHRATEEEIERLREARLELENAIQRADAEEERRVIRALEQTEGQEDQAP